MKTSISNTKKGLMTAAFVSTALIGCGGGGTSIPPSTSVNVNGGISVGSASAPTNIDATTTPVSVTLPDGTTATVYGGFFARGDPIITIEANTGILQNLYLDDGRAEGDVFVNPGTPGSSVPTKVTTIANLSGTTSSYAQIKDKIGFQANRDYTVILQGPFVVTSGKAKLHIKRFVIYFVNSASGSSLPAYLSGQLPTDGGTTFDNGQSLAANFPAYAGQNFRLRITKSNGTLQKVVTADSGGNVVFSDTVAAPNSTIPSGGVDTVELDYYQVPF